MTLEKPVIGQNEQLLRLCRLRRTRINRRGLRLALLLLCALSAVLAITVVALVVTRQSHLAPPPVSTPTPQPPAVCRTRPCAQIGGFISQNVNLSADPCEDFFEFACGGYAGRVHYGLRSDSTWPEGRSVVVREALDSRDRLFEALHRSDLPRSKDKQIDELFNITRATLEACMRWKRTEEDQDIGTLVGPLVNFRLRRLARSNSGLEALLGDLTRTGMSRFFRPAYLDVVAQGHQSGPDTLGSLSSFMRARGLLPHQTELMRKVYGAITGGPLIFLSALDFGFASSWGKSLLFPHLISRLARVRELDFLSLSTYSGEIARLQGQLLEWQERGKTAHLTTVQRLTASTSDVNFNWPLFFTHAIGKPVNSTTQVLLIADIGALKAALNQFINLWNIRRRTRLTWSTINGGLTFLMLESLLSLRHLFPLSLRLLTADLYNSNGLQILQQGPQFCATFAASTMPPITAMMLNRLAELSKGYNEVRSLISRVQLAMKQNVEDEAWISAEGKQKIAQIIDELRVVVGPEVSGAGGAPELLKSLHEFATRYYRGDNRFGHLLALGLESRTKIAMDLMTERRGVNLDLLSSQIFGPATYNAMHFMDNIILFAGYLSSPVIFNPEYPSYLRHGALGYTVGHEIGHRFDFKNHEFPIRPWDAGTEAEYQSRARCIRDSYSRMELTRGFTLNGSSTMGENMADGMGLAAAFRAFKSDSGGGSGVPRLPGILAALSPEEMFFVGFAQQYCERLPPEVYARDFSVQAGRSPVHGPGRLRILGALRHSRDFAGVFKCRRGSRMNPEEKCHLW